MSVYFNGQRIVKPGVYSQIDVSSLTPMSYGSQKVVALIGTSIGGPPVSSTLNSSPDSAGPVVWLNDPSQAASILKGGDLLDAANFAWKPSTDSNQSGADLIAFVRVNPAIKALLSLNDANGNSTLNITSKDWGAWNNQIQVSITDGSVSGKMVSVVCFPYNISEGGAGTNADNLGSAFLIQYTGNGTAATFTLTKSLQAPASPTLAASTTGGNIATGSVFVKVTALNASGESIASAEATVDVTGPNGSVTATWTPVEGASKYNVYASNSTNTEKFAKQVTATSYALQSIPTSGALAPEMNTSSYNINTYITGQTDNSQNIDICIDPAKDNRYTTLQNIVNYISGQVGYKAAMLGDANMESTYLDTITAQGIIAEYIETALLGSILYWINTYSQLITATAGVSTNPPANTNGYVNLAGGFDGTPTNTDWQNAIMALKKLNINYPVPLTPDATIQAMFDSANQSASGLDNIYRRGFYGGTLGETDAQVIARAHSMNSDRGMMAPMGFYQNDASGVKKLFPAYMLAAMFAGIAAGRVNVSTPLTNKHLNILGLERQDSNTANLISNGVAAIDVDKAGNYYIVQGITTSSVNNEYYIEFSVGDTGDQVRADLDDALSIYPGTASNGTSTASAMIATATSVLKEELKNQLIEGYDPVTNVIQSDTNTTAWRVPANVYVRDPINYVLVALSLLSGAAVGSQTITA